nr:bifunctional diguanylate cyclase/phosphodiesterase [Kineococcus siccus]
MFAFGARRGRQLKREHAGRRGAETELERRAREDRVTGLANRPRFLELVEAACADPSAVVGVLLVDLEGFADVNETLGHDVGDAVLAAVGQRLLTAVGPRTDGPAAASRHPWPVVCVARVGDDTFGLLLAGDGDGAPSVDDAAAHALARHLLAELEHPLDAGGVHLQVEAHAGVALGAGSGALTLLRRADAARAAGRRDGSPVRSYDDVLQRRSSRQLLLQGQLRQAIANGELIAHYQPKVACGSGRVTGVEALVRWQHPDLGLLPPADFLEIAEQSSLIRPLTVAVLDAALADVARWAAAGTDLGVAVNLSARVLDADLPGLLAERLRHSRVTATRLELELTETAALTDAGTTAAVLHELRRAGHPVSIDDFGTGHAGLAYLRDLPATTLKVDRQFVSGLPGSVRDTAIVVSTVEMAHRLGMTVVAEGVEDAATWQALTALGCDEAQGFWMSRPVPARDVPAVVARIERLHAVPAPQRTAR